MDKRNQINSNILSKNILKEIELLPTEFREKSEELKLLQEELNEFRSQYIKKENEINIILQNIRKNEDNLTINLEAMSKLKIDQKILISLLNEEFFINFKKNFYKIQNNFRNAILLFLKYEGKLKEELNFLLIKPEHLQQLLKDSYSFYKSLEESEQKKYDLRKNEINNLIKEENKYDIDNKNSIKLESPFDIIIIFINNTFKIIDINKYNTIIKQNIKDLCSNKNILFIQNKLLEEKIIMKEEKIKKISSYIKNMNNILIKYQNYFGNSNKNNNIKDNKSSINNEYNNKENNNIFLEFKNDSNIINNNLPIRNSLLLKSTLINDEKIKNNSNVKLKSLIKICEEDNNKPDNNQDSQSFNVDIKKKDFYHSINNYQKNNYSANTTISKANNNFQPNSPNNIKIISIISNSNNSPQYLSTANNIIPFNKNSNSSSIESLNQQNFSAINSKSGKKIKIGSLSLYQSTTSKKYKKKIIKTNSFEQGEPKKIIFNKQIANNQPNKSYNEVNEINDFYMNNKHKNNKNDNINKNEDNNFMRVNEKFYYSLNDEIKVEDGFQSDKKLEGKKIIVENINMMSDSKLIKNSENSLRSNFYLSPGIYSNNRKILKMFEMKKMKDKYKK